MNPVIYTPRGAAREYARLACNVYQGCTHGCSYCFGPNVTHKQREEFLKPGDRGADFLRRVEADASNLDKQGERGQVHLCFTTDPYQPLDDELHITRQVIEILHSHGMSVAILTKGGTRALKDIDLFGPLDAMAATMTYARPEDSLKEEPNAALPQDRFDAIKKFHDKGVPTWVSCEPVLDPNQTLYLIKLMAPWVDHFKVGKLNHDPQREKLIDWKGFAFAATVLLEEAGYTRVMNPDFGIFSCASNRTYYIKDALKKYLEA